MKQKLINLAYAIGAILVWAALLLTIAMGAPGCVPAHKWQGGPCPYNKNFTGYK